MFTLKIKTDNAAFDGGAGRMEIAELLRRHAALVERGQTESVIMDSNGNRVGSWKLTGANTALYR